MKSCLKKIMEKALLTFEKLRTVILRNRMYVKFDTANIYGWRF